MKEYIGTCNLCYGNVVREIGYDIEDMCDKCGAVRLNYMMEMEKEGVDLPARDAYTEIESEKVCPIEHEITDDLYNIATY